MEVSMKKLTPVLLVLIAGCGTPGQDIAPLAGDFAFIELSIGA